VSAPFVPAGGGLYFTNESTIETPPGSHLYAIVDSVADPIGSGLYPLVPINLIPQIEAHSDQAPSPRVVIYFESLPSAMRYITVTAFTDDDSPRIVRDARMAPAVESFLVTDYEAPWGRPITYAAEMFDENKVSIGLTSRLTTEIPIDANLNDLTLYIADPLDPGSAVRAIMSDGFAAQVAKTRNGNFVTPSGSSSGSVLLAGASQGYTSLPLDFYTDSREATLAFRRLRDQTPIAVLRFGPDVPLPGTIFVALLDPAEVPIDATFTQWVWSSRQVRSPETSIVVPLHTYQDYMDYFGTYAEAMATFYTYADAVLNPPVSE
jgi:hypothetical protein